VFLFSFNLFNYFVVSVCSVLASMMEGKGRVGH